MARRRQHGEDLTYAEWHRCVLADHYTRIGHRLDMADRDWTEFCHFCKEPLGIVEEVIDRGQDLRDKATTVTRRMAERADLPALLVAPRFNRPADVQRRIDELNREIRRLESLHPIVRFTVRRLWPSPTRLERLYPDEFASEIHLLHRHHHRSCRSPRAQSEAPVYRLAALQEAYARSRLWVPVQERLALDRGDVA